MAVIIKDFGMPSCCENCDLHNYHFCDITTTEIEKYYWEGGKPNDCPLRSADEMIKEIGQRLKNVDYALNVLDKDDKVRPKIEGAYDALNECLEIIHKYCDKEINNGEKT